MARTRTAVLIATTMVMVGPGPATAQIRASERGTVTQVSNGTTVSIDYSRPKVRGRHPVFGKLVEPGEVWTPGANWATTFEFSRDVTVDGHPVKKGKYSVWFVVRPGTWTVVLDPRHQRYHTDPPDSTASQVRWTVRPRPAPFTEVLTWSVPDVTPDGGVLRMNWGTTRVDLPFSVPPRYPLTISRPDAEPYLGVWEWKWTDTPDTTVNRMELHYDDGMLRARYSTRPKWWPAVQNQPMVRIADDWFVVAIMERGKVLEMTADMVFEFTRKDGRPVSLEVRDDRDLLLGTGKRLLQEAPR